MTALNTFCRDPDPLGAPQVPHGKTLWVWARGGLQEGGQVWIVSGIRHDGDANHFSPAKTQGRTCSASLQMLSGAGYKVTV